MNGLMLHCGSQHIDRAGLYALPDPTPRGPQHMPVHHADFVEAVEGRLGDYGYEVRESAFGVNPHGSKLFGLLSVTREGLDGFNGGEFVIGLRASHDMSLPLGLAAGSRVFVCDNLCFSGEIVLKTKQTTHVHQRLPTLLDDMVRRLGHTFEHQLQQLEAYRVATLSQEDAGNAIYEMGRRGVVNWSELGKVSQEWENPSHDEHAEDGNTVWRLFNAATESMKIRNPDHPRLPTLAPKTAKLHAICDQLASVPAAAAA